MVECEFENFGKFIGLENVLIDTWWNVNMISAGKIANMYGF